jgi:hypothetical protein
MLDSCFTAVAFYEMMRIYRDRPEAYLEDTVKLQEILRVLNLQWKTNQKKKRTEKTPALLRATKSMKEYKQFKMKLCINFFNVGDLFAREFLCR